MKAEYYREIAAAEIDGKSLGTEVGEAKKKISSAAMQGYFSVLIKPMGKLAAKELREQGFTLDANGDGYWVDWS